MMFISEVIHVHKYDEMNNLFTIFVMWKALCKDSIDMKKYMRERGKVPVRQTDEDKDIMKRGNDRILRIKNMTF